MLSMKNGLVLAATLLAAPALAESFDVTGTGSGEVKSTMVEISPSLILVKAHTDYTGFEGGANNPLAGATGPCTGTVLVSMGQPSGSGVCHYTDTDGQDVLISWEARAMTPEGRMMGIWSVEGGTGKWAKASGGGQFDSGMDANGVYSNKVSGALTMP